MNIPPSAFADVWELKPDADVCVGLRLLSELDVEVARAEAAKRAWESHPKVEDLENRHDAFNDALMTWFVARGTCDPNDVTKSAEIWQEMAEEVVPQALTPDGIRAIYDELEALSIATSPIYEELDDVAIEVLAHKLAQGLPAELDEETDQRVRRLLGCIAEALGV